MKPFLKWPGGKYKVIPSIKELLPTGKRLIEPFVGSGAVFLNVEGFEEYVLADVNQDLIHLYKILQTEGEEFIQYCKTFFNDANNNADTYYALRDIFNSSQDIRLKSALFLYLNRFSYNGLVRYNSSGKFNAPFGKYKRPYFPEEEMRYFYRKSQSAIFICADFRQTLSMAKPGDVIYADPPYVELSNTANFTEYSTGGFGKNEHEVLTSKSKELANNGIYVLLSNHETQYTLDAYSSAQITSIEVQRNISCDGSNRQKAKEVLALFRG